MTVSGRSHPSEGRQRRSDRAFSTTLTLRERHRRAGEHRAEQPERGERNADHVVGEGPEQALPDLARRCAATMSSASATSAGSPRISVMPAACIATSVPVAIAMPTSAAASAGASLMPSPTIATTLPPCRAAR